MKSLTNAIHNTRVQIWSLFRMRRNWWKCRIIRNLYMYFTGGTLDPLNNCYKCFVGKFCVRFHVSHCMYIKYNSAFKYDGIDLVPQLITESEYIGILISISKKTHVLSIVQWLASFIVMTFSCINHISQMKVRKKFCPVLMFCTKFVDVMWRYFVFSETYSSKQQFYWE